MAKKPKIKIILNSAGIEELLKSQEIQDELDEAANDLKKKISGTYKEKTEWDLEKSERSDRAIVNITSNDPDVKWKEIAEGKIAAKVGRKSRKNTRTQEQNRKIKEKEKAREEERERKKAYWASPEGKAERKRLRAERKLDRELEEQTRIQEERDET